MQTRRNRTQTLAAWIVVALVHLIVLWWLALTQVAPSMQMPIIIDLLMPPTISGGGSDGAGETGAASAASPSALHRPDEARVTQPAPLLAPADPAVEPPLVIGASPLDALTPLPAPAVQPNGPAATDASERDGSARGGSGTSGSGHGGGTGVGPGSGSGRGEGSGRGAQLIRGPQGAVMTSNPTPAMLAALTGAYAVLDCYVESGSPRLQGCRVRAEQPGGSGAGALALERAKEFRYLPPARIGRAPRRVRQTVAIAFPGGLSARDCVRPVDGN